ncbi:hypothetical protein E8E11_002490 [Didymella keratinophila]|nr:hypothetical protein E8E11_002490 [Didymella keratinophila]
MGWVSTFTVTSNVRLKMLTRALKSIRAVKRTGHYEHNYPTLSEDGVVVKLRAEEGQRPTKYAEIVTHREAVRLLNKQENDIATLKQDKAILRQEKVELSKELATFHAREPAVVEMERKYRRQEKWIEYPEDELMVNQAPL